jgi:hypothetical protein
VRSPILGSLGASEDFSRAESPVFRGCNLDFRGQKAVPSERGLAVVDSSGSTITALQTGFPRPKDGQTDGVQWEVAGLPQEGTTFWISQNPCQVLCSQTALLVAIRPNCFITEGAQGTGVIVFAKSPNSGEADWGFISISDRSDT